MEMAEPPSDGLNFFLPWGLLEWVVTGIVGAAATVALWVWRLGARVGAAQDALDEVAKDMVKLEAKFEKLEMTMAERLLEAERAREALKDELLARIADLPSRVFIESQMQQLTGRIDGLIDVKLFHRSH
jgi:hypothetical protein